MNIVGEMVKEAEDTLKRINAPFSKSNMDRYRKKIQKGMLHIKKHGYDVGGISKHIVKGEVIKDPEHGWVFKTNHGKKYRISPNEIATLGEK